MKVLIVKTSSMGDVIHTLPALTDAGRTIPNIRFDWVVEERFADIPSWHPLVHQVIPVAWRRWRKNLFSLATYREWRQFRKRIAAESYDLVIDAQGLIKSAVMTRLAKGLKVGMDKHSARESWAAYAYQTSYPVLRGGHAIQRVRRLFAEALHYVLPNSVPDYGVTKELFIVDSLEDPYFVFLHGTTWETKHWPEAYWVDLVRRVNQMGFYVKLAWGNAAELARAQRIAAQSDKVIVLPSLDLCGMAKVLVNAKAAVAVDTGLGHLAAALDVPMVSLYGPTDAKLTGALGQAQVHLSVDFPCSPCLSKVCTYQGISPLNEAESCVSSASPLKPSMPVTPPCFSTLAPDVVWDALAKLVR